MINKANVCFHICVWGRAYPECRDASDRGSWLPAPLCLSRRRCGWQWGRACAGVEGCGRGVGNIPYCSAAWDTSPGPVPPTSWATTEPTSKLGWRKDKFGYSQRNHAVSLMCKCFNKNKAIAEETNTISGPGQFYNQRCYMRRILNWKLWKLPTKQKDGGRSREGGGASWNLILGQN